MPKVNQVKRARKPTKCGKCNAKVAKGQPYVWWKFRFGGRHVRCTDAKCKPKRSELTQSEFYATLYDIQEADFAGCTSLEDLESLRDDVCGQLEDLRDQQEEKRSNMPDSLQDSDSGNLLQERYDALEDMIRNLQNVDFPSEDDVREEAKEEAEKSDDGSTEEEAADDALQAKLQELAGELEDYLQDISC